MCDKIFMKILRQSSYRIIGASEKVAFWASWKSGQLSHFKVAMIAALTVASGASVRVA